MTNQAPSWFDKDFYLVSKLDQLQAAGETQYVYPVDVENAILAAGFATVYDHFDMYSIDEGTSPNDWFNTDQYLTAKAAAVGMTVPALVAAIKAAGMSSAYEHFAMWGWKEGINPSNAFDVSEYLVNKAAQVEMTVAELTAAIEAAGLDPVSHYMLYGQYEETVASPFVEAVSAGEQLQTGASGLVDMMATLADAQDAAEAYLLEEAVADEAVAADIVTNQLDATDSIDVRTAVANVATDAELAVDGEIDSAGAAAAGAFVAANDAGKAGLIAAARALLKAEITADEAILAAAQADVDAIDGLQAAITAYEAAVAAETAALAATDVADAKLVGEIAGYEALNATHSVTADATATTDVTIAIGSAQPVAVIEFNLVDKVWELTAAATEAAYPGITDLFTKFVAAFDANAASVAATTAASDALTAVTDLEVNSEYAALVTAQDALTNSQDTGSEDELAAFEASLVALAAIQAIVDELGTLDTTTEAAALAIAKAGFDLDALGFTDGNTVILAQGADALEAEVYTVDGQAAQAVTLGVGDALIVTGFTYNDGNVTEDGDNAVIEFFLTETSGGDVEVSFETSAFGSNAVQPELVAVTLTGVTIDDLTIGANFITLA